VHAPTRGLEPLRQLEVEQGAFSLCTCNTYRVLTFVWAAGVTDHPPQSHLSFQTIQSTDKALLPAFRRSEPGFA
jgi:hypothetical protein